MRFDLFKNNKTGMYGAYKVAPELRMLMNSLEYQIASLTTKIFNIHSGVNILHQNAKPFPNANF